MKRFKSKKPVLSLEECTHPFTCVFKNGNHGRGVFVSVNNEDAVYPLNTPVALSQPHFYVIKDINKRRKFYDPKDHDYDPFKDPAYL